jgi:hypothetical protein
MGNFYSRSSEVRFQTNQPGLQHQILACYRTWPSKTPACEATCKALPLPITC